MRSDPCSSPLCCPQGGYLVVRDGQLRVVDVSGAILLPSELWLEVEEFALGVSGREMTRDRVLFVTDYGLMNGGPEGKACRVRACLVQRPGPSQAEEVIRVMGRPRQSCAAVPCCLPLSPPSVQRPGP
jgi:hypothetical protein